MVLISKYHVVFQILIFYILHASAHFLQASAQDLQQSISCLEHSVAQASQHLTHNSQRASAKCESLAHNLAHNSQMSAQSRHSFTHSSCPAIVKHMVAHFSHSIMQAKQESIQTFEFFIFKTFTFHRLVSIM